MNYSSPDFPLNSEWDCLWVPSSSICATFSRFLAQIELPFWSFFGKETLSSNFSSSEFSFFPLSAEKLFELEQKFCSWTKVKVKILGLVNLELKCCICSNCCPLHTTLFWGRGAEAALFSAITATRQNIASEMNYLIMAVVKTVHVNICSWTLDCGELVGTLVASEFWKLSTWIETICLPGTIASPKILGSSMFRIPASQAARESADMCSAQHP